MKKRIMLSLAVFFCCTMGLLAQVSQMATLTHGTTTTSYYGPTALSDAYTAAVNGDIITLTGGDFAGVNIEKAITLRGNGALSDAGNGTLRTRIEGQFTINLPSNIGYMTKIEGIEFYNAISITGTSESDQITFLKSILSNVNCSRCTANFIQCTIEENLHPAGNPCYIFGTNCIVGSLYDAGSTASGFELDHCTIIGNQFSANNVSYKNCVIISGTQYYVPSTSSCSYCVGFSGNYDHNIFQNIENTTTCTNLANNRTGFFEDESLYGSSCNYRLSNTAAATYLGNDGTQVGVYGGNTPWNMTPTNPRISTFSVSATNNNNTLNVRLNVQ